MLALSGLYCRSCTNIRLTVCLFKNFMLLNMHFAEHKMDRFTIKKIRLDMLLSAI